MINWKQKLSSRKFWVALVGFISAVLFAFNYAEAHMTPMRSGSGRRAYRHGSRDCHSGLNRRLIYGGKSNIKVAHCNNSLAQDIIRSVPTTG